MNKSLEQEIEEVLNEYASKYYQLIRTSAERVLLTPYEKKAKAQLLHLIDTHCQKRELDPFDFVEPCEPNCNAVRHGYHQGQWDMAERMQLKQTSIKDGEDK